MLKLEKKAFFFLIANSISLILGFILYLTIITSSENNLAKLMFTYSIHLILGSILTFGSNLYLFNGLISIKKNKLKLNFIRKNNFFIFKILVISFLIVIFLSSLDLVKTPYRKNFDLPLWPLFLGSFFLAYNKIIYFCFLGFKFYKQCYSIIILRPLILLVSIIFFTFKSNISFEVFVAGSFIASEIGILLISISKLKKIDFFQINFFKSADIENIKNSLKLFGDYLFAEIILKIDIFFSMIKFELKNISIYLISLVFIEGMLTFTMVLRNYFSSQYGKHLLNNNFNTYNYHFKKFALFSFLTTIFFITCSFSVLFIFEKYLPNFDKVVFKYLAIMCAGYLFYSIFAVSELMFLNRNKYLKQTYYFLTAVFVQLFCILFWINKIGIMSFPISIAFMFISMSLFILLEHYKLTNTN